MTQNPPVPPHREIVAILHTTNYRGDHSADVEIPHAVTAGETAEALCHRLLDGDTDGYDFVELRFVQPAPVRP